MRIFNTYDSPARRMVMCCENGCITDLCFEKDFHIIGLKKEESEVFGLCRSQLDRYFNGSLKEFSVPLSLKGTEFQHRVWEQLIKIPYGETASYRDIAVKIGNPKAFRAVGSANKANPVLIIVPCHRVIGLNGNIKGYSGGSELKEYLLGLERKNI